VRNGVGPPDAPALPLRTASDQNAVLCAGQRHDTPDLWAATLSSEEFAAAVRARLVDL
jgi:hypothetical protein